MAGELIKITNNLPEVQAKLKEIARRSGSMRPAFKGMGEYLKLSTRQDRFDKETDPHGKKWKAIKEATRARKARKGKPTDILHEDLNLRDTIDYDPGEETLLFGSPQKYAAAQQLGAEITVRRRGGKSKRRRQGPGKIKIDAREFLGVSMADEVELLAIAGDYLLA